MQHVKKLVSLARTNNLCLIPFGGGTSVTHSVWCPPKSQEPRPIVSVDMRKMNKILWVNREVRSQRVKRASHKLGYRREYEPLLTPSHLLRSAQIKRIQAIIRGMITRKWLALWYKNRFLMIVQWQARIRRFLSNVSIRKGLEEDQLAAVKCQKCVRMYLAKCYAKRQQLEVASERIQCMWRGIIARARCDKKWLDGQVTVLQAFVRFAMAKGKFEVSERSERALMKTRETPPN